MKTTTFALVALAMAGLASESLAGSIANSQLGQNRSRSIVYADPTDDATDTFTLEVDFIFPATQQQSWDERQWAYVYFLREPSTGDSGTMVEPQDAIGNWLSIVPQNPVEGGNINFGLEEDPLGLGETFLAGGAIPFDNNWHRLKIEVDGANNVTVSVDESPLFTAVLSANPGGEHYGILQRFNSATNLALVPHFDNFAFDGVVVNSFDTDLGTPTHNVGNIWIWDAAFNSDYVPSSSVADWITFE